MVVFDPLCGTLRLVDVFPGQVADLPEILAHPADGLANPIHESVLRHPVKVSARLARVHQVGLVLAGTVCSHLHDSIKFDTHLAANGLHDLADGMELPRREVICLANHAASHDLPQPPSSASAAAQPPTR